MDIKLLVQLLRNNVEDVVLDFGQNGLFFFNILNVLVQKFCYRLVKGKLGEMYFLGLQFIFI